MFDLDNTDITTYENAALYYKEAAARVDGIEKQMAKVWDKLRGDDEILMLLDSVQDRMDKVRVAIVCGQNALKTSQGLHAMERLVTGFLGQVDEMEIDFNTILASE